MKSETSSTASQSDAKQRKYAYTREWKKRNRDKVNATHKVWLAEHPDYYVDYHAERHLRKTYGITRKQRDAILASQGDACAVCGTTEPTKNGWHTDHDHATHLVRGILCHHCNLMLGQARDNPATLLSAVAYLEKAKHGGQEETPGRC